MKPIDMILYCPNCGMQHIDAPEPPRMEQVPSRFAQMHSFQLAPTWDNPPHKSHLCHGCRCVWRPADAATNGVAELKTSGKDDTWPAVHNDEVRAMPPSGVLERYEPIGRYFMRDGEWVKAAPESPVGETLYRRTAGVAGTQGDQRG